MTDESNAAAPSTRTAATAPSSDRFDPAGRPGSGDARLPAASPVSQPPTPNPQPPRRRSAAWRLEQHLREMPMHRVIIRAVEAELMAAIDFPRPVLDVGCGDGHFASTVFETPADVGLDPWFAELEDARKRGAHRYFVNASAETMPFPDRAFASVMSNCVVEHIPDLDAALRETARVLRPGGLFVLTVPTDQYDDALLGTTLLRRAGLRTAARAYGRFFDRISYHRTRLTPAGWRARLEAAGFTVEESRGYLDATAMYLFDASHWLGAPSVVTKRLLGRWILFPDKTRFLPLDRLAEVVRRQIDVERPPYMFFRCRRRET